MKIKYLDSIHNLERFHSIVKIKDKSINLIDYNSNFVLEFKTEEARNFILKEIWISIRDGKEFFDIDEIIDTVYDRQKYNI
jgi:hypothetical protein